MPNFTEHVRSDSRAHAVPDACVTITRRGLFALNRAAAAELGHPATLVFLVDEDEARYLGFRSGAGSDRPYPVRRAGGSWIVSGVGVLRRMRISHDEARRYPLVTIDGVKCIDLSEPGTVVTSNRRRKANGSPGPGT